MLASFCSRRQKTQTQNTRGDLYFTAALAFAYLLAQYVVLPTV